MSVRKLRSPDKDWSTCLVNFSYVVFGGKIWHATRATAEDPLQHAERCILLS